MDKEFLVIIFGIIGLLSIPTAIGIESPFWSLIVGLLGAIIQGIGFSLYGKSFWYGFIMNGIPLAGLSSIWAKIKGESVLVGVKWSALLLGIALTAIGFWMIPD